MNVFFGALHVSLRLDSYRVCIEFGENRAPILSGEPYLDEAITDFYECSLEKSAVYINRPLNSISYTWNRSINFKSLFPPFKLF